MLGSTAPASLHTSTATTSATPASPTRPGRIRGLSYLRSLHSHASRSDSAPLTRSASSSASSVAATPQRSAVAPPSEERGSSGSAAVSPSRIESADNNGWLPTIQGRSGLSRQTLHPTTTSAAAASSEGSASPVIMTRSRTANALGPTPAAASHDVLAPRAASSTTQTQPTTITTTTTTATAAVDLPTAASTPSGNKDNLPTIRFIPHIEARSSRPSLQFSALSRTLKGSNNVVRVGRYSERDHHTGDPATFPVGFKSKVVSRRHCEFWCTDGQWYVKDVKSSSGTFLNHVRLSSPGVESRPYPVNDGDVVQLGIDFKGGEEVIFRCVKIRVECNRGWQKSLNSFNTSAHKRLLNSALKPKNRDSDAGSVNSSECSICLNPVAPCQALFVAPCSHVWHYKCVRNLINSPQWPNFLCPNCRFVADLEADVEPDEEDEWATEMPAEPSTSQSNEADGFAKNSGADRSDDGAGAGADDADDDDDRLHGTPRHVRGSASRMRSIDEDLAALLSQTTLDATPSSIDDRPVTAVAETSSTRPINIAQPDPSSTPPNDPIGARSMTPTSHAPFALATGSIVNSASIPRSDAAPSWLESNGRARGLSEPSVAEVDE